jgi:hypothetical protein
MFQMFHTQFITLIVNLFGVEAKLKIIHNLSSIAKYYGLIIKQSSPIGIFVEAICVLCFHTKSFDIQLYIRTVEHVEVI